MKYGDKVKSEFFRGIGTVTRVFLNQCLVKTSNNNTILLPSHYLEPLSDDELMEHQVFMRTLDRIIDQHLPSLRKSKK